MQCGHSNSIDDVQNTFDLSEGQPHGHTKCAKNAGFLVLFAMRVHAFRASCAKTCTCSHAVLFCSTNRHSSTHALPVAIVEIKERYATRQPFKLCPLQCCGYRRTGQSSYVMRGSYRETSLQRLLQATNGSIPISTLQAIVLVTIPWPEVP